MAQQSMIGYIYKTTNRINGKIYVGMHRVSNGLFDDSYLGSGKILKKAIEKYGKDNFYSEIIEWCDSDDKLSEREIYWIHALNSMDRYVGYNMNDGGIGGWKIDTSGENNPMYGVHRFGSSNPNYGNKRTTESKRKQSESIAMNGGHHGAKNPMYGRKHSDETKIKISMRNKGKPSPMLGVTGEKHHSYGTHWWCDGINPPVKSKEQPSPNHHLGRK